MALAELLGLGVTIGLFALFYSKSTSSGPTPKTSSSLSRTTGREDGYEGPFHYRCESCGTGLSDDLDIRSTGTGYECQYCGHELNNQSGAETVYL